MRLHEEAEATDACPYCSMPLEDPGEAFMRHLDAHPSCRAQWSDFATNLGKDTLAD